MPQKRIEYIPVTLRIAGNGHRGILLRCGNRQRLHRQLSHVRDENLKLHLCKVDIPVIRNLPGKIECRIGRHAITDVPCRFLPVPVRNERLRPYDLPKALLAVLKRQCTHIHVRL